MRVAALAGLDRIKAAYAHAVAAGYRSSPNGDACLIEWGATGYNRMFLRYCLAATSAYVEAAEPSSGRPRDAGKKD